MLQEKGSKCYKDLHKEPVARHSAGDGLFNWDWHMSAIYRKSVGRISQLPEANLRGDSLFHC